MRIDESNELWIINAAYVCLLLIFSCTENRNKSVSADEAISSVSVIGTIGMDGSKPKAIAVEYKWDLAGAELELSDFSVTDYGLTLSEKDLNAGNNPGEPVKIYLNDKAEISEKGGSSHGNFVIIELNVDYSVSRYARSYLATMAAGVRQVKDIKTSRGIITAGTKEVGNYYSYKYVGIDPMTGGTRPAEFYNYAYEGTYTIPEISGYELHMTSSKL